MPAFNNASGMNFLKVNIDNTEENIKYRICKYKHRANRTKGGTEEI